MSDINAMIGEYRELCLADPARLPLEFAEHTVLTERERSEFESYLAREAPLWQINQPRAALCTERGHNLP